MSAPIILSDNRFRDGTPTATDTATGYDVRSIKDYRTWTTWKAASSGTKYLTIDCTTAKSADTIGVIGHNLATVAASLSVESSTNGSDWTERLAGAVPSTDKALCRTFTSVSARYWRVKLASTTAAAEIGEINLGVRLTFPKSPDLAFTPYSADVVAEHAIGKTGVILGATVRYTGLTFAPRWTNLSQSWVYGDFWTFWDGHGRLFRPFFWVPDLTTFTTGIYFVTCAENARFATPMRKSTLVQSLALDLVGLMET